MTTGGNASAIAPSGVYKASHNDVCNDNNHPAPAIAKHKIQMGKVSKNNNIVQKHNDVRTEKRHGIFCSEGALACGGATLRLVIVVHPLALYVRAIGV